MWLGELIDGINQAMNDINAQNYGSAHTRLHRLMEEAKQNGIVTMIKVD